MAHEKFRVEVLTPEGEVFNDEVEMVSTRTAVGSIGVLAHHEPVLAMLDPTEHGTDVVAKVARRDVSHEFIVASLLRESWALHGFHQHLEPFPVVVEVCFRRRARRAVWPDPARDARPSPFQCRAA